MNEFPRRFGPYVLLKPLARGGMGALYLALTGPEDVGRAMRHQDGAAAPGRQGVPAAVSRRGQGRRPAVARQPGARVRFGAGAGRDLPGDGLRAGQRPARHLEPLREEGDRVPGRRRGAHREGAGARARLRARLRRHQAGSPRRLAAQRAAVVQRRGEADRLRAGVVDAEAGEDGARDHLRQGQLHVARSRRVARRSTGARICTRRGSSCGSC